MPVPTALREALNQGISSGIFTDTKIILYSHRDSAGRVCQPKALYANSHVLKTVPYFEDLLFGNFAESQSKDLGDPIDNEEFAEAYGYFSDSDLEDGEDEKPSLSEKATKSEVHLFDPFETPDDEKTGCEVQVERIEKGKVVKIPDIAFVTFQAFLMYLYTDVMKFAPFGSEDNRRWRREDAFNSGETFVQSSPKSIYRLADKYDIPALRTLALNSIRSGLEQCNIVEESFSRFTSQYDEIRTLYVQRLAFEWMDVHTGPDIPTGVETKVKSFFKGDHQHATEIISSLWEIANDDGVVKPPSNTNSLSGVVASDDNPPTHWDAVIMALSKSIHGAIFFDRKYWARHSKAGDVLKPVYFSSIIIDDKAQELNKLIKHVRGRNPLIKDLEGDVNVESDCDGDVVKVKDELPNLEEGKEETRTVLITGSFSAWKSLFFYHCTDAISFAPLKSQGVDSRLNYIRDNTISTIPPPCSPKSIYVLAHLLGIQPLRDKALADIKSKVTSENVVSEVFSWVTASQDEIMEMQCDLLVTTFKDQKTIALVKENIRDISDGSSSHHAAPLQLGLIKAFELKKNKKQPPGTRCSRVDCPSYQDQDSSSSIPSVEETTYCCQKCCIMDYYDYCE